MKLRKGERERERGLENSSNLIYFKFPYLTNQEWTHHQTHTILLYQKNKNKNTIIKKLKYGDTLQFFPSQKEKKNKMKIKMKKED